MKQPPKLQNQQTFYHNRSCPKVPAHKLDELSLTTVVILGLKRLKKIPEPVRTRLGNLPIVALLALTVSINRQVIKKSKLGNISSSGDAGALIRLVKKSGRAPFSFLIREVARPAHTVFTFVPSSPPC
ncbi:hypothetical protein ACLB2K_006030 [Fragaria x ananassa]